MPYLIQLAEQLHDLFEQDIIIRGKQLQQNNTVTSLQVKNHISACVNDPHDGSCNTFIQLDMQSGALSVDGECSCEQEFNCKHVVATLLAYLDTETIVGTIQQPSQQAISNGLRSMPPGNQDNPGDKQMHFVLSLQADRLQLQLLVASTERVTTFIMPHSLTHPARFIQPADLQLLQQIQQQTRLDDGAYFALFANSGSLLKELVETTRCHWQAYTNPVCQAGGLKAGKWLWHQHIDGSQQLKIKLQDDSVEVLPVLPLIYRDKQQHHLGLIDSGLTPQQDQQLFLLPAFQPEDIESVLHSPELAQLLSRLPRPKLVRDFSTKQSIPDICVKMTRLPEKTSSTSAKVSALQLFAQIYFKYPGGTVKRHDPTDFTGEFNNRQFVRWLRDTRQENKLVDLWQELGWEVYDGAGQLHESWHLKPDFHGLFAARFIAFQLPHLIHQGWCIECDEDLPQVFSANDFLLETEFSMSENHRQFRLKMLLSARPATGVAIAVQSINLLQAIMSSLQLGWLSTEEAVDDGQSILSTQDKQLLIIKHRDLQLILDCLIELNSKQALDKEGYLLLSRARLQAVHSLIQSLTISQAEVTDLSTVLQSLNSDRQYPVEKNDDEKNVIKVQLRPYQQQGVEWLHLIHQHGLGGLLADDMGLGKTLQILTFLWQCKCRGTLLKPVMILAPTSLLGNWQAEVKRFTPGLSLLVLHGAKRANYFNRLTDYDLVVSSYPLLIRDVQSLLQVDWQMLILDEAQAIKNADSRSARAVREFNANINICMSGTPVENHLGELWALFDFMLPGLLGSKRQFKDWFQIPIQQHNNTSRQELLVERIAPVLLRRSKARVLPQLPPKIQQMETIELTDEQQLIYHNIEAQMRQSVRDSIQQRGVDGSRMHILNALTRLRQVCCDPRLLTDSNITSVQQSAKLLRLLDMLDEMLSQGRRVLVFSQFTSLLSLLQTELKKKSIDYALLTGQTRRRDEQIERFQQGDVALFLISLKAGGSGLNLTRADTVIHYDPWWNPAVENQATDRAHRIGQFQSVMVYKLITTNTIEQKIVEMQQDKQLIADNLLEGSNLLTQKSNDLDVKNLLHLLGV